MAKRKRAGRRDNVAGIKAGPLLTFFLMPGMIIQWFRYMNVSGKKYGSVRENTRRARSPLVTWVYSILFWVLFAVALPSIVQGFSEGWESRAMAREEVSGNG